MSELEQLAKQLEDIRNIYFFNGCNNCPFYSMENVSEGIENGTEEDTNFCDSVPINCKFWALANLCKACDAYEKMKGEEE